MKRRSLKWIVPILVSLCVAMSAHEAQAYFFDGNNLVEWMRAYDKMVGTSCSSADPECIDDVRNACTFLGYVMGVHDSSWYDYSVPEGVTVNQLAAVVSKYLKEHPERWSSSAYYLVKDALQRAFPGRGSQFTPLPIHPDRKSKVK